MKRIATILKSSPDHRKYICADQENWERIKHFLLADRARVKKFWQVCDSLLLGLRIPELYGKEDIDKYSARVTAIKLFKTGQNIGVYCKEQTDRSGVFYIIVAELVEKKKDKKIKALIKNIINKVGSYEYEIK